MSVGELTNRVRQNYTRGVLSQQIAAAALSATSADFTAIPEVIQGDQFALLALDPDAVNGAPELAKITEHAAGSDTIIIERHVEGTLARLHPVATVWRIVSTADDFALIEQITAEHIADLDLALAGYLPLAGGIMTGDLLANGNDIDMGGGSVTNLPSPPVAGHTAVSQDFTDGRYLQLAGGAMTGPLNMGGQLITNAAHPLVATDVATRGYITSTSAPISHTHVYAPTPHGNTHHSGDGYAPLVHSHSYAPANHDNSHHSTTFSANPHGDAHHTVNYATSGHTHSYLATGSVGTLSGLKFDELIPYHSGDNGSLRWIGVNSEIAQRHTSSSLDYKADVEEVDLRKSVFSKFYPIHFWYRADHPFKDRWADWDESMVRDTGHMGLAYEDVVEVAPEWVYEADGMKCIGYDGMLPDLIADYLALRKLVLDSLGV